MSSHGPASGIRDRTGAARWLPFAALARGKRIACCLLATVFLSQALALAGPESEYYAQKGPAIQPSGDASSPWEVRIGLPAWIPEISGDFGIRDVNSSVDTNLFKHVSSLDALFVGSIYVRYNRWEIFGDGFYGKLSSSVTVPSLLSTPADLELETGFAQAFLGYRVINTEKGYLSLFAGARYNYMAGDLQIFANPDPRFPNLRIALGIPASLRVSGSTNWVDPVVGVKGKVHVWKPISLWATGTVGGFSLNSGTSYTVNGGVEFQITRYVWLQTGWCYLKNDYDSGGFVNNLELNGPLVQLGFNF